RVLSSSGLARQIKTGWLHASVWREFPSLVATAQHPGHSATPERLKREMHLGVKSFTGLGLGTQCNGCWRELKDTDINQFLHCQIYGPSTTRTVDSGAIASKNPLASSGMRQPRCELTLRGRPTLSSRHAGQRHLQRKGDNYCRYLGSDVMRREYLCER
ncbi:hypothetical protein BaRGS_00034774, partial [Batillaria attramentaria]